MIAYEYCFFEWCLGRVHVTFSSPTGIKRKIYKVTSINKDEFEGWKRALPEDWYLLGAVTMFPARAGRTASGRTPACASARGPRPSGGREV